MKKNRKRLYSKIRMTFWLAMLVAGLFVLFESNGMPLPDREELVKTGEEVSSYLTELELFKGNIEMAEEEQTSVVEDNTLIRAYTVKINELVFSLRNRDEVLALLQAAKDKFDPDNKFEILLKMDPDRQLEAITASLQERQTGENVSSKQELVQIEAGAGKTVDEASNNAGSAVADGIDVFEEARNMAMSAEDYNGTDAHLSLDITALAFADSVEVAVTYIAPQELTKLDDALLEITRDKQKERIYEVQSGDTLSQISERLEIPMTDLVQINDVLEDENSTIRAGDELTITVPQPELSFTCTRREYYEENYNAETEYVANDEWFTTDMVTLQDPIAGYHRVIADVTYLNDQELSRTILKEEVVMEATPKIVERGTKIPPTFIRPISGGRTSSGFGRRTAPKKGASTYHKGIDWAIPVGTAVVASSGGVVGRAGWGSGYGNVVYIIHPDGRETRYGHLSKILVKPGQSVTQGQKIALSGNTGRSTGPHLHFEILINGSAVNPMGVLTGR